MKKKLFISKKKNQNKKTTTKLKRNINKNKAENDEEM